MEWTRLEKRLAILWLAAAFWTALCFLATGISSLIIFLLTVSIIGIPLAFILGLLPSVLLYLTAAAPVYLLFRKRARLPGALVSIVLVGSAGIMVPTVVNRQLEERVATATLHDGGGPVEAPKGAVIAYLSAYRFDTADNTQCEDYCQRLLFSGAARVVIRGSVDALGDKRTALKRYWFGPANGPCHPAEMTLAHAGVGDIGQYVPVPLLQQKAQQMYGDGLCFFQSKATLDEADLTLARDDFAGFERPGAKVDLRLSKMLHQRWIATYERSGTRPRQVMRVSHAVASRLTSPLRLQTAFVFDTFTPAQWATSGTIENGRWAEYGLDQFLTNDVRVHGLTTEDGKPLPL